MPLSTTLDRDREESVLSLDWVLTSGICAVRSKASGVLAVPCDGGVFSVPMDLNIISSLSSDLVLGREGLQYGRESVSETCFYLSTGQVDLRCPQNGISSAAHRNSSHFSQILLKINLIIATQPLSTSTRPNPVSTDQVHLSFFVLFFFDSHLFQMMECPTVSVLISLVAVVPPHRLFL